MEHLDYRKHDAVSLAQLVRDGEITPAELLDAALDRAHAVNGKLNAITRYFTEIARERANGELSGPLAGVPFLLKDLGQEWAGTVSSAGSRALRNVTSAETAEVVQRWLDAGLVVFGRTNSPEFGIKPVTEPEAFGPTRNPWDLSRSPGGSSGGSAAAVAAGIVPVAAASDGGGSIRIPASWCGLFGLKPGRGLVPSGPLVSEQFHGAAVDGVISRTVRDSAAALDCLVGPDPTAPYHRAAPERSFSAEVGREPGRLRIGFSADSAFGEPHPEARAGLSATAELLESLGHHVESVACPVDTAELAADFLRAWMVKTAANLEEVRRTTGAPPESFEVDTRLLAAVGRHVSGPEYVSVLDRWHEHTRRLAEFHSRYDLLLTPTTATPPPRVGQLGVAAPVRAAGKAALTLRLSALLHWTGVVEQQARNNLKYVPYTQLANLTGRPAMTVPLHWTGDGLPIGMQFVAPLGGEGMLFRLAAQLEQARPWSDRYPDIPVRSAA